MGSVDGVGLNPIHQTRTSCWWVCPAVVGTSIGRASLVCISRRRRRRQRRRWRGVGGAGGAGGAGWGLVDSAREDKHVTRRVTHLYNNTPLQQHTSTTTHPYNNTPLQQHTHLSTTVIRTTKHRLLLATITVS